MNYLNFHSHRPALESETVVRDGIDTWGIHPWYAAQSADKEPDFAKSDSILFIGECGLDRACDTPWEVQMETFKRCIALSEELHKPLVLHCVRAIDDCMVLRRRMACRQPWVIHGFAGSARKLASPLRHGCYFSFGFNFRADAVLACPASRLLIESDEDERHVAFIYGQIAQMRGLTLEQLKAQVWANYNTLLAPDASR